MIEPSFVSFIYLEALYKTRKSLKIGEHGGKVDQEVWGLNPIGTALCS